MNINPEIPKILVAHNINPDIGTLYLVGIYFELIKSPETDPFPEHIGKQINLTKIVERDYANNREVVWKVPLFFTDGVPVDKNWLWIEDYRNLFGQIKHEAIGNKRDCEKKMQKFFSNNPHVRKEDVMQAANLYLSEFRRSATDPKYLQRADYFISKIVRAEGGSQYNSRLEMYLEIIARGRDKTEVVASRQMSKLIS